MLCADGALRARARARNAKPLFLLSDGALRASQAAFFDDVFRDMLVRRPLIDFVFSLLSIDSLLTVGQGFAGLEMLRRVVGIAHVADIDSIVDESRRVEAERRVLVRRARAARARARADRLALRQSLACALLRDNGVGANRLTSIEAVCQLAQQTSSH